MAPVWLPNMTEPHRGNQLANSRLSLPPACGIHPSLLLLLGLLYKLMTFRHELDSVLLFRGRVMQAKMGLLGVRDGQVTCLVMLGSAGDPLCASLCPFFVRHGNCINLC